MSYTTRCPACGTMFKVVPDQLKISDGWVRCGHCADVFDATLYLEEWAGGDSPSPMAAEVTVSDETIMLATFWTSVRMLAPNPARPLFDCSASYSA